MGRQSWWCLGLLCGALWCSLSVTSGEDDPDAYLQSEELEFPGLNGGCVRTGQFLLDDTLCWLTVDGHPSGQSRDDRVGENSLCDVISGPRPGLYRCKLGMWSEEAPPPTAKPLNREKKGWWRRRRRRRRRHPPPPPPNQAPYFTSCPGNIHVTAPANQKSAVVTYSVTAADNDGSASLTKNTGASSGSHFNEGDTTVSYTARDNGGLTATCAFVVKVTVVRCPYVAQLSSFLHGSQRCSGSDKNLHGSACSHSCDLGYVLRGQGQVTCQSSGSWDSAFPSCDLVTCGDPGQVAGGKVECPEGHSYARSCAVQCRHGYSNDKVSVTTCKANGQWSDQLTPCIDTEPPSFPNGCPQSQQLTTGPLAAPVTVTWVDPEVKDNSDEDVTLTSDLAKGSKLGPGDLKVTLTATDKAGNRESCDFLVSIEAKQCPELLSLENGQYTCTHNNVEGSVCTAACDQGYALQGASKLECLPSGDWCNDSPVCEAIMCPSPPSVLHGTFQCVSGLQHASRCQLACDAGFRVRSQSPAPSPGDSTIQCLDNGTWSVPGSCEDVQAPEFPNGCTGDVKQFAAPLGSNTLVSWSPPDVIDNSGDAVTLESDVTPGTSFQPGTTVVTYQATDAAGHVTSCTFNVTVEVLQCLQPSDALTEGEMASNLYNCSDGYVQGARCTVTCARDHTLVGESSIACGREMGTYPPRVSWQWENGPSGRPVCREDLCPMPEAPKNGALSCHLGTLGPVCQVWCNEDWGLTRDISGHLSCINERGTWSGDVSTVETGCVKRKLPHQQQADSASLHYYEGNCTSSSEELRQAFVTRMKDSVLKDACIGVPSCTARNIKVICGPTWPSQGGGAPPPPPQKRTTTTTQDDNAEEEEEEEADSIMSSGRDRDRQGGGEESGRGGHHRRPHPHPHKHPHPHHDHDHPPRLRLRPDDVSTIAVDGQREKHPWYDLKHLPRKGGRKEGVVTKTKEGGEGEGEGEREEEVDCPPGTVPRRRHRHHHHHHHHHRPRSQDDRDDDHHRRCVECPPGHFVPPGGRQCQECPPGTYAEGDRAVSCTACPPELTTPSSGATHVSQCKPQ